jgi:phenylalanyl-tRNA synthetase beta chain
MHISYNWLCELIPGLANVPARELADKLTLSGLEVESFVDQSAKLKGIVVGLVVARDKHPNADKLSLCRVNAGAEEFQVVCGAPNVTAGKKYPFATLGTVMPDGLEIKPIKLRGVESFGMLCSAKELGHSDEHGGLYELPADAGTGAPIAGILGLNDVILGLNVTPNRGDALSHWGVARDVAALTGLKVELSSFLPRREGGGGASNPELKIELIDAKSCPRYSASVVSGVKIAPSPTWLKTRLESLGMRSINNVVDATNAVMLLTGHPVHAFDAKNVSGRRLRIFSLGEARKFKTLDGAERDLAPGDVVIADANGPVALAGIMGGGNSEVTDDTSDLVLEVAMFDPDVIRRTSRRLGLQTESSYRFARFVNPETVLAAHETLSELIVKIAGGTCGPILDFYPEPFAPKTIRLTDAEIMRLLGIAVQQDDVVRILTGLSCTVEVSGGAYEVTIPVSRSDLERPADLIEEVARIYGMDKIPYVLPRLATHSSQESRASSYEREIKDFFIARGFAETVHYSFGDADYFSRVLKMPADSFVALKNPLSEDLSVMRPSLLPHLLAAYKKNHLNTDKGLRLFEARKVYAKDASGVPTERRVLAALYAGNPMGRNPYGLARVSDFYDGKGLISGFFAAARIAVTESIHREWPYHGGQSVAFSGPGGLIATHGALHPELLQSLKIKDRLYYLEVDGDAVASFYKNKPVQYAAIGALPPVYRDMAVLADKSLTHEVVLGAIRCFAPRELRHAELFDSYEGANLPAGKKSLAYSFVYQPETESLTDEAVNAMHFALVEKLKVELGVELR